jgi:excisionase family DNA binding protein
MKSVTDHHHQPLAYSITDACRVSSLGRSFLYSAIANGSLASVTVGRRRLIKADSLRALIESGEAN